MLCCLGLVAGFAVGAALGGPWAFPAPIAGFGLGLIGDLTLIRHGLHGIHKKTEQRFHVKEHEIHNGESTEV